MITRDFSVISMTSQASLSLSLLLTKVTHAQYRKRFRASYNYARKTSDKHVQWNEKSSSRLFPFNWTWERKGEREREEILISNDINRDLMIRSISVVWCYQFLTWRIVPPNCSRSRRERGKLDMKLWLQWAAVVAGHCPVPHHQQLIPFSNQCIQ